MPHDAFERLESVAGITEFRHRGNGLRLLHLPDASTPTATVMVTYLVGSRHEPDGLTGATHFLEHLMFKGTDRYNRDSGSSVFQTLQRLGAQVNATTWVDRTNYYAMLPSVHVGTAMAIEADRMRGARIRPVDVEDERTVILNELDRGENEPLRRLVHAVFRTAFEVHPYRHPTIGWREDVASVTADALRGFYDTYYWPDNAVVSVIGDVTEDDALGLVHGNFGAIPRAPSPVPSVTAVEALQAGERRTTVSMTGEPPAVLMAWKAPRGTDPEADALDLLAMVLSFGRMSRLYRALVDTGLAIGQSVTVMRLRDPGLFYAHVMLAPGTDHDRIEDAVRQELSGLVANGVAAGELERARAQLRAHEAFSRDGPYAMAGELNEAIAAGDWRLFATLRERSARLGRDEVVDAAARFLQAERLTVGRFVPVQV
jgi:zinc protease